MTSPKRPRIILDDLVLTELEKLTAAIRKSSRHPHAVIGLGGLYGAGKDVFADALVEHLGFTKLGMSDALHEALMALNPYVSGTTQVDMGLGGTALAEHPIRYATLIRDWGYVEAKKFPEVRRLLQTLGTEVVRDMIDKEAWTNAARRKILAADGPVVITGMRFPNEMAMVRSVGGRLVWISRPPATLDRHGVPVPTGTEQHVSETTVQASDFDEHVINGGTVEDLAEQALIVAGRISQ